MLTVQVECFARELAKLLESTTAVLQSWRRTLEHDCTRGSISTRLDFGVEVAENKAVATSDKWSAHRLEGGLVWATYKVNHMALSCMMFPLCTDSISARSHPPLRHTFTGAG